MTFSSFLIVYSLLQVLYFSENQVRLYKSADQITILFPISSVRSETFIHTDGGREVVLKMSLEVSYQL